MKMHKLSPILWTKNLDETISFYTNVLGFCGESHFLNFISLNCGDVEIMFVAPQSDPDTDNNGDFFQKPALTGSIHIVTENVDSLWEIVKDKAVVKTSIADREYFMRDFSILDNNGYELVFGEHIENKTT